MLGPALSRHPLAHGALTPGFLTLSNLDGGTALDLSAGSFEGDATATVAALLEGGAALTSPARKADDRSWTPFQDACYIGQLEAAKLLLAKGAAIDAPDHAGSTPLMLAAENGRDETVKFLIAAGASLDAKDSEGRTAMQRAAESNMTDKAAIVALLREAGAGE